VSLHVLTVKVPVAIADLASIEGLQDAIVEACGMQIVRLCSARLEAEATDATATPGPSSQSVPPPSAGSMMAGGSAVLQTPVSTATLQDSANRQVSAGKRCSPNTCEISAPKRAHLEVGSQSVAPLASLSENLRPQARITQAKVLDLLASSEDGLQLKDLTTQYQAYLADFEVAQVDVNRVLQALLGDGSAYVRDRRYHMV